MLNRSIWPSRENDNVICFECYGISEFTTFLQLKSTFSKLRTMVGRPPWISYSTARNFCGSQFCFCS